MKTRFGLICLLLVAICSARLFAQDAKLTFQGKIISLDNHQPVPYANIQLKGKSLGTAANYNGEFILRLNAAGPNDTLQISSVGFTNQQVPLSAFKSGDIKTIALSPSNIALQQVSVAYRDPMKIINKAIERIPENYLNAPHVIRGFYRQTTMKGQTPLQLSEAVFDIYNYGYGNKKQNLFKLVKARDDKNERDFRSIELGQNPAGIFNDDIVKHLDNSKILGQSAFKRHSYQVMGIVDFKGSPAYQIEFTEKPGFKENTYRGKIFIDTKSYAFVYFDYGLSPDAMKAVKFGNMAERALMGMLGMEISVKANRDRVSYQKNGDKWFFQGDVGDIDLYIKLPRMKYDFLANVKFNYIVTQTDTTQTTPFEQKMRESEHINDHDTNEGEEFWKDYNIMLPDYNTEVLIKQINAINSVSRLKSKFEERARKLPKNPALLIDSMLTYYNANGQFNGTALIKNKGQILLSKSYGYADKEKQQTANAHTTYRIGSLSKSFTSVIINQLMAGGKIDVHAPVKNYLPWYANGDVTIGQLLTHQSGIPEYFNNNQYKMQMITKTFTLKEVVQKFCSDSLEFKSGTAFSYSNANFAILALIAQEVSHTPFEQLLQQRIFTPLQMNDTYFGAYLGSDNHQATGYSNGAKEITYSPANTAGAGGISSSASDLLKFHNALLTDQLLSKPAIDTMLKTRVEFKDYNAWYDYGWMTDKNYFTASKKHVISYHPGTDLGFFTMYVREPDSDSCIILLNNTGEFPRYDLAEMILNILN